MKKFTLYILRIIGIILVCCVAVVAGGHLIGRTLLEIIYGVDLSPYKLHFVVLLIGGGISAEVYMIYNILISIRWGKCLLPVYSITAVITITAARILVQQLGIMGAALNYVLSCSILFVLFTLILVYVILRKNIRTSSINTTSPERKCPFIGTILSGGCFFIFLSDLCVEADTLVYFHSPITPTPTASHAVVLSRILQVRTIRGWYALHRLFLPAHGDGRDSKTDGDVGVCAGGTDVQGFHANGLICSICSLDNLAGFFLGTSRAPALLFEGDCNAVIFC